MSLFERILKDIKENKKVLKMDESPVYVPNDWENGKIAFEKDIRYELYLKKGYEEYFRIDNFKIKNNNYVIVFLYNKEIEEINVGVLFEDKEGIERIHFIGYVSLIRNKSVEQIKKEYKPLYQVSKIYIEKDYRGFGLGKLLYSSILEILKFNIMSDGVQFDGPKHIYSKFSHFEEIHCDIVDIENKIILKEDYKIYHNPKEFWDFDMDVWSYDYDKYNTRIVLYT